MNRQDAKDAIPRRGDGGQRDIGTMSPCPKILALLASWRLYYIIRNPDEITAQSFRIIEEKLKGRSFPPLTWPVIRQVIHATADFEFADILKFHPGAIDAGIAAIRSGQDMVVDVQMVAVGINQALMRTFVGASGTGGKVYCFITDEDIQRTAESQGITRSMAAMRKAAEQFSGQNDRAPIFVIGTAPTALLELISLIREEKIHPSLIIGVPVGFVSTVKSKEALRELTSVPWITTSGPKGGSSVAVATVNALLGMATES